MAIQHMHVIRDTTSEPSCARVFLKLEMVTRAADMLNYFLKFLAGPERRQLRMANPEKYGWDPKELLRLICGIYLHLADVDANDAFAKAVAADGRSYNDECFREAALILRSFGLLAEGHVARLEMFAERVRAFCDAAMQEEEDLARSPVAAASSSISCFLPSFMLLPAAQSVICPPVLAVQPLTLTRVCFLPAGTLPGGRS